MKGIKMGLFAFALFCATGLNAQTHEGKIQKEEPKEAPLKKVDKREDILKSSPPVKQSMKKEILKQEPIKVTK